MRNTMQRFWATHLLELRLTHWSYLLFLVVWSGFIVITYTQNDFRSISGLFNIVLGFGSLIGMFLTGIQASRVQRNRFDVLESALPSGVEVLLARWLAILTTLGGLLIAPLFVLMIAPAGRLDSGYVLNNLLLIVVSLTFATGLVWLVQNTIGIRRWMYPLFGLLWIGSGMLPNLLGNDRLPLPGINLVNFVTLNQPINTSLWGSLNQGNLALLTVLFYIGIVLLFAGVMLWRTLATRFHRRSPIVMALTAAAVVLVLLAGSGYTAQVYAANQQIIAEDQHQQAFVDQVMQPAEMPFQVTAYDVSFALGTPSQFTAQIDVLNRSEIPLNELTFSLYHQFEVTDTSAAYTRDRDLLTLTLPEALPPGDNTQVSVNYQGNIAYMERRFGRPPEATYFVRPEGVNLACAVLWYPVPGQLIPNYTHYNEYFQGTPSCPLDQPAVFRLTIADEGGLQYTSNLPQIDATTFESQGTTWTQLIGAAALQTTTDGRFTIITTPKQYEQVRPLIHQRYLPALEHLQRFFPESNHLTVVALELAPDSWSEWGVYPAIQESLVVFITPRAFDYIPPGTQGEYYGLGEPLIASIFGGDMNTVTQNMIYFLWIHYLTRGDSEQMGMLLESGLPTGGTTRHYGVPYEEIYRIAFTLYDVYVEYGEAAVVDVIQAMRAQMDTLSTLSNEEIAAWIQETADAD